MFADLNLLNSCMLVFVFILMQVQEKEEQVFGEENLKMNLVNI